MTVAALVVFGVGVLLELAGFGVAVRGVWKTWHEHLSGEAFWAPVSSALKRAGRGIQRVTDRVLRRRRPQVVQVSAVASMASVGHARGRVMYSPLPDITEDSLAFASEVDRRLAELLQRLQDAEYRQIDRLNSAQASLSDRAQRLDEQIAAVETESRSIAIGGLREQVIGLLLIVAGFTAQACSTFMQAAGW